MSTRSGRALSLAATTGLILSACGPGSTPATQVTTAPASPAESTTSASTEVPGSSVTGPVPPASGALTQTDTEWGRIWDAVPPGFPRYPGSTVAADAESSPVSAAFAIESGDPKAIAAWFQSRLESRAFRTEGVSGPLEDGSYVLDSAGAGSCRSQVRVAPAGGLTLITVLYGAGCPLT